MSCLNLESPTFHLKNPALRDSYYIFNWDCERVSQLPKKKYESLVKRRGKKRAIIAIACMILTAIYKMLSTGEQWNPSDLYKIDMPEALVEKQKAKAIKQAKKLLQREGLLPPDEPLAS